MVNFLVSQEQKDRADYWAEHVRTHPDKDDEDSNGFSDEMNEEGGIQE